MKELPSLRRLRALKEWQHQIGVEPLVEVPARVIARAACRRSKAQTHICSLEPGV